MRRRVLEYVCDDLITAEMNPFDAALALLALAKLGAEPASFASALSCLADGFGEGGWRVPFKAYEWNKALVHARRAMTAAA